MTDDFTGRWLVTEYVHDDNGACIGIVHQTRLLRNLPNGHFLVVQHCWVSAELADHPMGAFAGKWVFEMKKDGNRRRYLGADVVGLGISLTPQTIVGQGRWPRFGYDFLSFGSIMDDPARQLTGGVFYNGTEGDLAARIVGIAVAETEASQGAWQTLASRQAMHAVSPHWQGTKSVHLADGTLSHEGKFQRSYDDAFRWQEVYAGNQRQTIRCQPDGRNAYALSRQAENGTLQPVGQCFVYDYFSRAELKTHTGRVSLYEVFDQASQCLLGVGYCRASNADRLTGYEVYRLYPQSH